MILLSQNELAYDKGTLQRELAAAATKTSQPDKEGQTWGIGSESI
ncbi:hypothetical protein [Paenibacillus sp. MBLB4367]